MSDALGKLGELLAAHKETLVRLARELGTPASHVDERLDELHQSLCSAVEVQRREAEDEVVLVRKRVQSLQEDIEDKRRVLGSAAEQIGAPSESLLAALADLETVREGLSATHFSRLARFHSICEHFEIVLPTVGSDFVSDGFVVPRIQPERPPADLTLDTLDRLQGELDRFQHELDRRKELLNQVLQDIIALWAELGIDPSADTARGVEEFDLLMLAHVLPDHPVTLEPSAENLSQAKSAREGLEAEKIKREQLIQGVYENLYNLWVKLGVSDEDQDAFLEHWKGIEQRCIDAYLAEEERMLQLKAENMLVFLQRERDDILRLGGEIYLSDEEQTDWEGQTAHLQGDDLLAAYEARRRHLLTELERRAPVLIPLNRYESLRKEARELAESAKDQTRFKSKGDPGRLLREEKIRKRHAKEKPKLEAQLLLALPAWEAEHGEPFMVNGGRYLDELNELALPKKSAIPPRSKTPVADRAKTPAPSEHRYRGTESVSRPGTASSRPLNSSTASGTANKRALASSAAATPLMVKRPKGNSQNESETSHIISSTGDSLMKAPLRSVVRTGGIPQLVYPPGRTQQGTRDYKPRPSLTTLISASSLSGPLGQHAASATIAAELLSWHSTDDE